MFNLIDFKEIFCIKLTLFDFFVYFTELRDSYNTWVKNYDIGLLIYKHRNENRDLKYFLTSICAEISDICV